jgi:hypothetical protein
MIFFLNSPPFLVSIYTKLFNVVLDPDYFRAITLISCLGKLFTSIVSKSFRKTENKKGNTFSPCLTHVRQGKKSD